MFTKQELNNLRIENEDSFYGLDKNTVEDLIHGYEQLLNELERLQNILFIWR